MACRRDAVWNSLLGRFYLTIAITMNEKTNEMDRPRLIPEYG